MDVIFLDIDGVLNCTGKKTELTPEGYNGIEDELIENVREIVSQTRAEIVLSSSWRKIWDKNPNKCNEDGLYLNEKLDRYNLKVVDKITSKKGFKGNGIKDFIKENNVQKYVILDDKDHWDFDDELNAHLVKVNPFLGLTEHDAYKAIKILFKD